MTADNDIVYIVDDDDSICRALRRLLKSAGYHALVFTTAEAFLDQISDNSGGCLVLDIQLPGMSGFELQEALIARGLTYRIIFVTAHDNKRWEARAEKKKSAGYLKKPFDEQAILDAVDECFRQMAEMNLQPDNIP
jgi:FixJ family two-component response regulator